jgi:hypothetical protein
MEASENTEHRPAIWSSNINPRDMPEGMWLRLLQSHLHPHVCCSTSHNSQGMEAAMMPPYQQMDQWNVVFILNGIFSATKKNEIFPFTSKSMEFENIILGEVCQAQKAKNHMFSLIFQLETLSQWSNIIRHGSHTKGRTCMGGIGKGKST